MHSPCGSTAFAISLARPHTGWVPTRELTLEDFRFNPPTISLDDVESAARHLYGLSGRMTQLSGERDQNVRIETSDGDFVLKIAGQGEDPLVVDLQVSVLKHLEASVPELPVPRVIDQVDGKAVGVIVDRSGSTHQMRLVTYLPGVTFDAARNVPASALQAIGRVQARMCRALSGFDHAGADHFMPWDISNGLIQSDQLWRHAQADVIAVVGDQRGYLTDVVSARFDGLRRQVIHNDAHRGNLLRANESSHGLTGVIDFGDMVKAPLVDDLAVSASSFVRASDDPITSVESLATGFNSVFPLQDEEVDALFDLILARLVLGLLLFDFMIAKESGHTTNIMRERPEALAGLARWLTLDPDQLTHRLHAVLAGGRT